jgi:hypothetical protein
MKLRWSPNVQMATRLDTAALDDTLICYLNFLHHLIKESIVIFDYFIIVSGKKIEIRILVKSAIALRDFDF